MTDGVLDPVRPAGVSTRRLGSLASVFVRHLVLFAGAAVAAYALATYVSPTEQPAVWMVGAAVIGVLGALIGRRWPGVVVVVAGTFVGLLLANELRSDAVGPVTHELSERVPIYAAVGAVLLVAYLLIALGIATLSRRRRSEPAVHGPRSSA